MSHPTPETRAPQDLLRDAYLRKKERNASYSTTAFARDLGISQTYLSLILNGKRKLPLERAHQFAETLGLDGVAAGRFLKSVALAGTRGAGAKQYLRKALESRKATARKDDYFDLEMDRFTAISRWYHLPILDLISTKGFRPDVAWIARKLGIGVVEARDAVERLVRLGLLEIQGSKWTKTKARLMVPTSRPETAVRAFHRQMIEKGLEALTSPAQDDFAAREISGMTMAMNPSKLAEAKKRIAEFQKELAALVTEGECTELYQLNVQFFNLVRPTTAKKEDV